MSMFGDINRRRPGGLQADGQLAGFRDLVTCPRTAPRTSRLLDTRLLV